MATKGIDLSSYNQSSLPNAADFVIGIVVSTWNDKITTRLLDGANETLLENGMSHDNIIIKFVPGAFELPLAAQFLFEAYELDGVIAIGAIIQGDTKHFDFVCAGTTQGLMNVMLKFSKPVAFCVLTDNNEQQSLDRSGGIHGNKGVECAVACLKMIQLRNEQ